MARLSSIPGCVLRPSDFIQADRNAVCEIYLRSKQHQQGHRDPSTATASKLVPVKKKCIGSRGTPDEGYTVIVIDECTRWARGFGVTTKSTDYTLLFMKYVVCTLKRQTGLTVKCIVCVGGKQFMDIV